MDAQLESIVNRLRKEETRWDAILELKICQNLEWVPSLIQLLRDKEWIIRWCVAEKLGELGDAQAIKPLSQLIADPDNHVRKNTTNALKRFGAQAFPYILPYFAHPNPDVRHVASELVKAQKEKGLAQLEKYLPRQNWIVSHRVVDLINRIEGPAAESVLIRSLMHEDVQKHVIVLLGERKSKDAIPYLVRMFEKPKLRRWILYTLYHIGEKEAYPFIIRVLGNPSRALNSTAEQMIQKIGAPILPYLVKTLEKKTNNSKKILQLMVRIGPEKVMPQVHALAKKDKDIADLTKQIRKQYPLRPAKTPAKGKNGETSFFNFFGG